MIIPAPVSYTVVVSISVHGGNIASGVPTYPRPGLVGEHRETMGVAPALAAVSIFETQRNVSLK